MKTNDIPIRIYSAEAAATSIRSSLAQAASEIWSTREIVWRLFVRDFSVQFRQKLLGYLWAFIAPLLGLASFVFMNYAGILNPGELTIPYPLYVFFGVTLWGLMTSVMTVVSAGLMVHSDLIMRTNIPKIALALTGAANLAYQTIISVIILLAIVLVLRVPPSPWAPVALLMVLPLVALGLGIGLLLAVIGALARDVTGVVMAMFNLAMFVTPVIYAPKFDNPVLQNVIQYNPLTHLIEGPRSVFFTGRIADPLGFAGASVLAVFFLIMGIHGFYLIQDKVAERL
jgi:ABC-type polysaccharide/polyol phosphate export permease